MTIRTAALQHQKKYLLQLCVKNFRAQREIFFFYKKILRFENKKIPDFSPI